MRPRERSAETETDEVFEGWEERRVGDCIELAYGKGLTNQTRRKGSVPVFGSNGVVGYHDEALVSGPGIIVGRKGSVGEVAFSKGDFWSIDTTYYVQIKQGNDMAFWYYFLKTLHLDRMNTHSAVPGLNRDNVYNIIVRVPSLDEQKAIGTILLSLDEKNELNNRASKNLKDISQMIFKHWFVDFEFPNEEGKPYKSTGGEMVDSELGEMPEGWKVGDILDVANLSSGGTPSTEISEYWGGGIPWVSAKDATGAHSSFILDTEKTITQRGIDHSNAKLLPRYTTVVTARGTVGSFCLLAREMAINQTNYGLKTKSGVGDFFVFFSVSNLVLQMKRRSYGTIFQTITSRTFKEMRIPVPPTSLIEHFDRTIAATMTRILHNLEESRILTSIRDSLIPKLMSGRIRVGFDSQTRGVSR